VIAELTKDVYHYQLRDGEILALTDRGRVTIRLLRMNRPTRIKERLLSFPLAALHMPPRF
jgi:hypothetical protein